MEILTLSIIFLTALGLSLIFIDSKNRKKEGPQNIKKFSDPWMGLKGITLWGVMTERIKIESISIDSLRRSYEIVLVNHITETFNQGKKDAAQNIYHNPPNEIMVISQFGSIVSWIPLNYSSTIYRCGYTYINQDPDKLPYIYQDLDETCEIMFKLAKIVRNERMSSVLMPQIYPDNPNTADESHTTSQDPLKENEIPILDSPIRSHKNDLNDQKPKV